MGLFFLFWGYEGGLNDVLADDVVEVGLVVGAGWSRWRVFWEAGGSCVSCCFSVLVVIL